MEKIIKIKSCMCCPKVGKCNPWKKLTPKQRITLTVGVGIGDFILKGCPLEDAESKKQ